jgi:hypothetical protein
MLKERHDFSIFIFYLRLDHECKIIKAIFNVFLSMRPEWYYYYGSISSIHVTIIHTCTKGLDHECK